MTERVVNGRMAFQDSSACLDAGFGTSTSLNNHRNDSIPKRLIAEKFGRNKKEQTIKFKNNLPYEVFLEIIEDDVVKISEHVKAIYSTLLKTKMNSIIIVHLYYMDKKWVFVQRVNCLKNLKMCKFVSEDGEIIQLGRICHMNKGKRMTFTVYSPVWITNDTEMELAYQEYHGVELLNSGVKIYHPPKRGFHQPVLLSYDMKRFCVAIADRLGGKENWTRVPLHGPFNEKQKLELIANGKFCYILSFDFPNSVVRGSTIFFRDKYFRHRTHPRQTLLDTQVYQRNKNGSLRTSSSPSNHQNDSILERVIAEKCFRNEKRRVSQQITIKFQNNLPCGVFLEVLENGVVKISQHVKAVDRISLATNMNSIIIFLFFWENKKWVSFQRVNCLDSLKMCEFIAEDREIIKLRAESYTDKVTEMTFTMFITTNNFVVFNW